MLNRRKIHRPNDQNSIISSKISFFFFSKKINKEKEDK